MYDNENDEFGEEVGAIKIKDGLFIGDYFSSSVNQPLPHFSTLL